MNTQEENWELMSWVGLPWTECVKLSDADRAFLLVKVEELKVQQEQQMEAQKKMYEEQQAAAAAQGTGSTGVPGNVPQVSMPMPAL